MRLRGQVLDKKGLGLTHGIDRVERSEALKGRILDVGSRPATPTYDDRFIVGNLPSKQCRPEFLRGLKNERFGKSWENIPKIYETLGKSDFGHYSRSSQRSH